VNGAANRAATLVAQAVAAVTHASDDELVLRCAVLTLEDPAAIRRALIEQREHPHAVPVSTAPETERRVLRSLEQSRHAATERYLESGELGGADEIDRIIDAVLLLAEQHAGARGR
jgi:hypothetical protein